MDRVPEGVTTVVARELRRNRAILRFAGLDPEDAAQEARLALWRRGLWDAPASGLAVVVARSAIHEAIRKRVGRHQQGQLAFREVTLHSAETLVQKAQGRRPLERSLRPTVIGHPPQVSDVLLEKQLRRLTPTQQTILRNRHWDDQPDRTLCAQLGVKGAMISTRASEAYRALRARITQKDPDHVRPA